MRAIKLILISFLVSGYIWQTTSETEFKIATLYCADKNGLDYISSYWNKSYSFACKDNTYISLETATKEMVLK